MKIAFDTSVLVPALVEAHPRHERANIWLKAVAAGVHEGVISWHAMAESWSVLTRLPTKPRLTGEEARQVLEKLREHLELIELDGDVYETAMLRCSAAEVSSGTIFDAIHLAVAEKTSADLLLTFNVKDFHRIAVATSPRIIAPPEPPGLDLDASPQRAS